MPETVASFQNLVSENVGQEISLKILREESEFGVVLVPEASASGGRIGIGIDLVVPKQYGFFESIWRGLKTAGELTWAIFLAFMA